MAMTTNTRARAWEKTYKQYVNLNQRLEQAQPDERDQLERAVAAQQDKLLEMNAPSFVAVMHKIEILWQGELESVDQTSEEKRQILCDLSDLCAEAAATIGYTSPFGSAA